MNSADIAPFLTLPPGTAGALTTEAEDWAAIEACQPKRVQLLNPYAYPGFLKKLRDKGAEHFTIRLLQPDWFSEASWPVVESWLRPLRGLGADTLLLGVELDVGVWPGFLPDGANPQDPRYSWKEWMAEEFAKRLPPALKFFRNLGFRVGSPALQYRMHYKDWRQGLRPQFFRWWEIMREAHNEADFNTFHLYSADGTDYDLLERIRTSLWIFQSVANRPIYIGEFNSGTEDHLAQANAVKKLATLLQNTDPNDPVMGPWAHSGDRVEGMSIFAINGDGHDWPARLVIKGEEPWSVIGQAIKGQKWQFHQ